MYTLQNDVLFARDTGTFLNHVRINIFVAGALGVKILDPVPQI
jgi:hypothetical protein